MDVREAIITRRSIRDYTGQEVPEDAVQEMLRAAMFAPSAGNQRVWHFIVVRERTLLDTVASIHPHAKMSSKAQLGILVCAEVSAARYPDLWVQDLSAATQNLLLMAHALGLGAVWCAVYPEKDRIAEFRRTFGLPTTVEPFSFVPVGYPAETPEQPERFDETRIHWERW